MKKSAAYLLLLVFLAIPISLALYEEEVFKGRVQSEEPFYSGDKEYEAIFIRGNNHTVIYLPEGYNLVINYNNETCADSWIYRACISDIKYIRNGREVPMYVHESNVNITFQLELYASFANLEYTRAVEPTTLVSGQKTYILTTIKNTGQLEADNITLMERVPHAFTVRNIVGCEKEEGGIFWRGSLSKERSIECSYTLVSGKEGVFSSDSELTYSFLGKSVTKEKSAQIAVQEDPLRARIIPEEINATANETFGFSILLEPSYDLSVSAGLVLPEQVRVLNYTTMTQIGDRYEYEAELKKGDKINMSFEAVSRHVGEYVIEPEISYLLDSKRTEQKVSSDLHIEIPLFYIWTEDADDEIVIKLSNPTPLTFSRIKLDLLDEDGNKQEEFFLEELKYRRYKEFRTKTRPAKIEMVFRTAYGQYITKTLTEISNITPYIDPNMVLEEETSGSDDDSQSEPITSLPEKKGFSFPDIPKEAISIGAVVLALVIIASVFLFRKKKSSLDDEISEILEAEQGPDEQQ